MNEHDVAIETAQPVTASVIWLHGLGADGNDFVPVVRALGLPANIGARFILPHAPVMPVTINGGMSMPAWYDFRGMNIADAPDREGIARSVTTLNHLIDREVKRGIPSERIVLAGFSQGGAIALQTGLTSGRRLAGILALSTYLPLPDDLAPATPGAPSTLMLHGDHDGVVPMPIAQISKRHLETLGYDVCWRQFRMAHAVCQEEVGVIRDWLVEVLNLNGDAPNPGHD